MLTTFHCQELRFSMGGFFFDVRRHVDVERSRHDGRAGFELGNIEKALEVRVEFFHFLVHSSIYFTPSQYPSSATSFPPPDPRPFEKLASLATSRGCSSLTTRYPLSWPVCLIGSTAEDFMSATIATSIALGGNWGDA